MYRSRTNSRGGYAPRSRGGYTGMRRAASPPRRSYAPAPRRSYGPAPARRSYTRAAPVARARRYYVGGRRY